MGFSKERILIADDETTLANILSRFLIKEKYKVRIVNDGYSAFQELMTNKYDLCLLDIVMSGMHGMDVLQKIKESQNVDTSIVMMTAYNDISTIIKVMKNGADDYVAKPIHFEELRIVIQRALNHRLIRLENKKYKNFLEEQVQKKTSEIEKAFIDIIHAFMQAIQTRDNYTGDHIKRVSEIAYEIGRKMGFKEEKLKEIRIGGILHDIGKIGIADRILKKKTQLTREEYNEIKKHPQLGYQIVKSIDSIKSIIPYILYHQERFDGKGYPKGLKGSSIPLEGRLLAVADAFEAMTSNRPYKKKLSFQDAYNEILSHSGTQFDPEIVSVFKDVFNDQLLKRK